PAFAAERALVYVAGAAIAVVGLRRERVAWLLGGLLGGISIVGLWALETRLFEGDLGQAGDLLSGTRLVRPLGYANGLGALLALGLVVAAGLALWGGMPLVRALAAGLLVPLAAGLYLTLSRGSVVALAVGLAVLLLRER